MSPVVWRRVGKLQYSLPVSGSSARMATRVMTMSCDFPPKVASIGEGALARSFKVFQRTFPVLQSNATTPAELVPPITAITARSVTRGDETYPCQVAEVLNSAFVCR